MADSIAALKASIWGDVFVEDDAEFGKAIKTWTLPERPITPAVVVKVRGIMDIQEALRYAKARGLEVAVRGGGHAVTHVSLVPGGVVVDLSHMRSVAVDPAAQTAVADGGCLLGDIDRETAVYGLAVPLGHAPVTGMGLALHGGIGVATHIFGPTSEHIIGATLVKADGQVVEVNARSDPDLLWALKGAGGAMGVVARIKFRLHDISDAVTGFMMFPDDPEHKNWKAIARWMTDSARVEPGFSCNLMRAFGPDGNPVCAMMVLSLGPKSHEERQAFLGPLRALGPAVDTVGKFRYVDTQFALHPMMASLPPRYEYWTSGQLAADKVTDEFLEEFTGFYDELSGGKMPFSMALFDMWGGGMSKAEGPVPFARATADIGWLLIVGYPDPALHQESRDLARKTKAKLSRHGEHEVYVNLTSDTLEEPGSTLAARVGGADNLARLRAVKARVDPDNVFKAHTLKGLIPNA